MPRLRPAKGSGNCFATGSIFDPKDLDLPLDWKRLFGKEGPVEIEVGCGKGRFLLERATQNPDRRFIGLEYARAYLETIAKRCSKRGLENVRVSKCEAGEFFRECAPDASLEAFHLLYPDPWPKKRHHKRRLIQHEFLGELRRVLKPGAELNLATDHASYFEWMLEHFDRWKGTFLMTARALTSPQERAGFEGRTNYEIKYLKEGRAIYLLTGRRTGF
jgi:tRNA (guanine-N7-)-methyltransferase